MIFFGIFRFILLISTIAAQTYHDHNDLNLPDEQPPTFLTLGQTYKVTAGGDVILPCRIKPAGSYVLVWKRGIAVLTAGPVKVTPDPRVKLVPSSPASSPTALKSEQSSASYSLELRDVRPQDAGDYICQVGTMEPKEIVHTLEILVPPYINQISHTGPLQVIQGATVKMDCRASGNPVPKVVWTRKNDVLPGGERSVVGTTLLIPNANRHSAGVYQCSADNGVGEPATRHIILNVLYAPDVEPEKQVVHTGLGLEAQLNCIVHAEPPPQVLWYKDTAQLGTTERHSTHVRGNRYTFVIRNISMGDFGNYSCVATNAHGRGRAELTLTGTAGVTVFDSPSTGTEKYSYNISWSIVSHAPILEYRLYYRPQMHHHRVHHETFNATKMGPRETWINVSIYPTKTDSRLLPIASPSYPGVIRQKMSYHIRSLRPGTSYEARVQARNIHGWNKASSIFHFATRSIDMENMVEPSAQPAVYGISQQGMAPFSSAIRQLTSTICVISVLVMIF